MTVPRFLCATACLLLLASASGAPAHAQDSAQDRAKAKPAGTEASARPPAPPAREAAYMAPLSRLSSILGSVHFLRKLCGDPNADSWRDRMGELIEAQKPSDADRRRLIASFNGGYRAFESTYRKCTPAARLAVNRYQTEGADLSQEIAGRYGN